VAIEALLFDLGKVLVDFDFDIAIQRFLARTALPRKEFEQVALDSSWVRRYESGQIATAEFHEYLQEKGKLQMSPDEFHEAWSSVFLPGTIVPERLLATLKASYPLILVSNTNESHARFIAQHYSVFEYFDHKIFSHVVGSLKPDRKIYEAAIAAAGKPPESLFFTDDRLENIEMALELGIHAHQFQSVPKLVNELQKRGVRVGDFVPS
jgi:glucose-1-phosphatase